MPEQHSAEKDALREALDDAHAEAAEVEMVLEAHRRILKRNMTICPVHATSVTTVSGGTSCICWRAVQHEHWHEPTRVLPPAVTTEPTP